MTAYLTFTNVDICHLPSFSCHSANQLDWPCMTGSRESSQGTLRFAPCELQAPLASLGLPLGLHQEGWPLD